MRRWSPRPAQYGLRTGGIFSIYVACNDQLYVASIPGLVSQRIKVPLGVQIRSPAWSPNGKYVAFGGSRVCDDLYFMGVASILRTSYQEWDPKSGYELYFWG